MPSKNTLIKAAITGLSILVGDFPMKTLGHESDIYDIEKHSEDFRALNCWECFDSKGKICHNKDASKHKKLLDNTNLGHGICCKPGSTNKECVNDSDHICSDPAYEPNPSSKKQTILSESNMNH